MATKSQIVKLAKKGKDFGKKGKGFDRGVAALKKKGYSDEAAHKIMGKQFWKSQGY